MAARPIIHADRCAASSRYNVRVDDAGNGWWGCGAVLGCARWRIGRRGKCSDSWQVKSKKIVLLDCLYIHCSNVLNFQDAGRGGGGNCFEAI